MAEVAEAAGLPVGNIYRRFRGKEELLQAIKYDVTARIDDAVAERLSSRPFRDIPDLIQRFAGATCETFASDEKLYRTLFAVQTADSPMAEIGASGRRRIFTRYREALLPFLRGIAEERAEMMVRVSFPIVTAAMLGKARGLDEAPNDLSWQAVADEFGRAAITYLQVNTASFSQGR